MSEVNDALSVDFSQNEENQSEENKQKMIENYLKSGQIAQSVRKDVHSLVNPGASALDIAESIEKSILDSGAKPAFPVNISINDIAAHYTPTYDDTLLIGEKDLVKVDFGVAIDGCICDNAISIDLSEENSKLLEASKSALDNAISAIKPGVGNGEIGKIIEDTINSFGFKSIDNLTGHKLEPYNLHAGVDVPNVKADSDYHFKEGDIFAIEPFATTGTGSVQDQSQVEIFSVVSDGKIRMRSSRELLINIVNSHLTLPFAKRWVMRSAKSKIVASASLRELLNCGCLYPYPVLREVAKGLVSQFEHTIIVEHDGARVTDGEINL